MSDIVNQNQQDATVLVRPSERYIKEKQTKSETKISNTADNRGITQSQARDTRYRRMQELNSLCVSK